MNGLPITALYAGILGLLLVALSLRVVMGRLGGQVSLGDAGQDDLLVRVRAQGNFIEYVPLALLLIGLVELGGASPGLVHGLGIALVVARVLHPFGLGSEFGLRPARIAGATTTFIVIAVASALAILDFLGS